MGKGTVVYREQVAIKCPNCGINWLHWLWTFKPGTNRKLIEAWGFDEKKDHCTELKEYCTSCGYSTLR